MECCNRVQLFLLWEGNNRPASSSKIKLIFSPAKVMVLTADSEFEQELLGFLSWNSVQIMNDLPKCTYDSVRSLFCQACQNSEVYSVLLLLWRTSEYSKNSQGPHNLHACFAATALGSNKNIQWPFFFIFFWAVLDLMECCKTEFSNFNSNSEWPISHTCVDSITFLRN